MHSKTRHFYIEKLKVWTAIKVFIYNSILMSFLMHKRKQTYSENSFRWRNGIIGFSFRMILDLISCWITTKTLILVSAVHLPCRQHKKKYKQILGGTISGWCAQCQHPDCWLFGVLLYVWKKNLAQSVCIVQILQIAASYETLTSRHNTKKIKIKNTH